MKLVGLTGQPLRCANDDFMVAVATDSPAAVPEPMPCPVLDLNNPDALAGWLGDNQARFEHRHPPAP